MQSVFPTSLQNVDPSLTQLQISQRLARDLQHFAFLWHVYLPLNLSPQFIYYHVHEIGKFDYIIYLNIEYITQFNILSYRFVSCAWNIIQCEYINDTRSCFSDVLYYLFLHRPHNYWNVFELVYQQQFDSTETKSSLFQVAMALDTSFILVVNIYLCYQNTIKSFSHINWAYIILFWFHRWMYNESTCRERENY